VDRRSGADHAGRALSRAHAGQAQAQGLEVGAHEPGHDHTAHLIGELSPGHAAPRWPMARGRPGRRAGSRAMITRPTCPTSASTPHAGEHETLVAHAAHLIAELEPHCRYTPASTSRLWTSASTIASWARAPWTRAEHTPASGSRAHAPGPRTSASWEPGQLVSAAHPVAELAHDHAAHCARRRRPPT
jgi:hypothetical protein